MKTGITIKNLVKAIAVAGTILIISTGIKAQSNAVDRMNEESAFYARMEMLAEKLQPEIMYQAPDVFDIDSKESSNEAKYAEVSERISGTVANLEAQVRYIAPDITTETQPDLSNDSQIEELIARTRKTLLPAVEYVAPSVEMNVDGVPFNGPSGAISVAAIQIVK